MLSTFELINCKLNLKILEWNKGQTLKITPDLATTSTSVEGNVKQFDIINYSS